MSVIIKAQKLHVGVKNSFNCDGKGILPFDLSISSKEVCYLCGKNGTGKSTILKTTSRLLDKIAGELFICEKRIESYSIQEYAKIVSCVLASKIEVLDLTVFDVLSIGRLPHQSMFSLLSRDDLSIIDEMVKEFFLEDILHSNFNILSDGQKQRVLIARGFVQRPCLLILDEPFNFLDIWIKDQVRKKIYDLAQKHDIAILMSTHDLPSNRWQNEKAVFINDKGELLNIPSSVESLLDL